MPYAVLHVPTNKIIRYDLPDEDAQNPSMSPDLRLLKIVYGPKPPVDYRWFEVARDNGQIIGNEYVFSYQPVRRPNEAVAAEVDNIERYIVSEHLPSEDFMKLTILCLATILRKASGLQLTPKENAVAVRIVDAATKLWQNDEIARLKKQLINSGQETDLDEGFVRGQ